MNHLESTQETASVESNRQLQRDFLEKIKGSHLEDSNFQAILRDQAFRQIAIGIVTLGPHRGEHQTGHFWPDDPAKVEALSVLATHVSYQETLMIRIHGAYSCGNEICFDIVEYGDLKDFVPSKIN